MLFVLALHAIPAINNTEKPINSGTLLKPSIFHWMRFYSIVSIIGRLYFYLIQVPCVHIVLSVFFRNLKKKKNYRSIGPMWRVAAMAFNLLFWNSLLHSDWLMRANFQFLFTLLWPYLAKKSTNEFFFFWYQLYIRNRNIQKMVTPERNHGANRFSGFSIV